MAQRYAAVGRLSMNGRTAAPDVRGQVMFDLTLNCDGEIDLDAAIHRSRFKVRRIVLGNIERDATVCGFSVQTLSIPAIARERNIQPAIHRAAVNIASQIREINAPIRRIELQVAVQMLESDATVHGLELG